MNYNGKIIGVNLTINNKNGYLPCYPSNIPNSDVVLKFIDDVSWNSYQETIDFLNEIKSNNNNILCQPLQRVIEDDTIIGINTETNQFIPFNEPVKYYDDPLFNDKDSDLKKNIHQYNQIQADKIILNSNKKDEERINYINKIKQETLFYNSFRNLVKILVNKYENHSHRLEIIDLIDSKKYMFYEEKMTMLINILQKICENYIEFTNYDKEVLNKIHTISLCFNNCNTNYCLKRENQVCKFLIPENNLMTNKSNFKIYYGKLADELIRHHRLRSYILDENSYLSFSKLIYNISDNEIILPQSIINKEYFDEFKNKNKINLNEFIISNSFDNAILNHKDLQVYNKKTNVIKNNNIEQDKIVSKQGVIYNVVNKNVVDKLKCSEEKEFDKSDKLRSIFENCKKKIFRRVKECTYVMFTEMYIKMFNKPVKTIEIKNKLIELYNKTYIPKYGNKIYDILETEGKNLSAVKNMQISFENYIISNKHFLSILDVLILANSYSFGILLINKNEFSNKGKYINFIKNGDYSKYIIMKIDKKAGSDRLKYETPAIISLIIKNNNDYFHSEDEFKKNNINVKYLSIDEYINKEVSDKKKAKGEKIQLQEN